MRLNRYLLLIAAFFIFPAGSTGASKEMMELQRDIAQLQAQIQTLQSTVDQKMATVQTLAQNTYDTATKANTTVSVLNAGVTSTLERSLHDALTPIAGLAAKVDNTNNDVAEVRNQMADMNNQMNKVIQLLTDISANIKVLQAAPAPPPGPAAGQSVPPPDASVVFTNAMRDQTAGKLDLAISEYQDFIKFYPDDPNAARAQYNIGENHYTKQNYEQAAQDFDTVITKYPENPVLTPQAYFLKGMALKGTNKAAAIAAWKAVVAKYPTSDSAAQAKEQARAMGVSLTGPATTTKRRPPH